MPAIDLAWPTVSQHYFSCYVHAVWYTYIGISIMSFTLMCLWLYSFVHHPFVDQCCNVAIYLLDLIRNRLVVV